MHLKIFLLPVVMMISVAAYAQDKIYKTDGEVTDVKIKSVGIKTVTYVRFDNQAGPEYTIVKNEVEKIVYQNGSIDVFERGGLPRPGHHRHISRPDANTADGAAASKINYKPNILSLAPIQFTENGLGVGLSYERAIDKDGIIAFYLPVIATWNLNNSTYLDNTGQTRNGHADMMTYAMPGIKIYPTGSYGVVRYSVGPSLVIGAGQRSNQIYGSYYPPNTTYEYVTQQHLLLGIMVTNSLNINPSHHIYLGLDFGFGFTYLDRIAGLNQGTSGLVQGGFKVGYRF